MNGTNGEGGSSEEREAQVEITEAFGSTRSLGDRDRQTGPVTPWHSGFFPGGNPLHSAQPISQGPPETYWCGKQAIQGAARKGQQTQAPEVLPVAPHLASCGFPGMGLARAGGSFLTLQTAETGFTCATAFPPHTHE